MDYVEDWDGFWKRYAAKRALDIQESIDDEEDAKTPVVVTKAGEYIEVGILPRSAQRLSKSLESHGWTFSCVASETFQGGAVYGPKAQKAGQKAPDKIIQHYFINAKKPNRALSASWQGGSFEDAACFDLTGWHYFDKVGLFDEWLEEGTKDE